MSAVVLLKNFYDEVKKIYTLGDDKTANIKKISLIALGAIAFAGSFFVRGLWMAGLICLTGAFLFISYNIESKNVEADKSNMTYFDFPRTKEHEAALDVIMDGISLGREGFGVRTLAKITKLAPRLLYRAGDVIHYHESEGKIYGVHTLRHLGYVLSGKENRRRMKILMSYAGFLSIVKNTYLEKMSETLNQLNAAGQIQPYLKGFAQEVAMDKMPKAEKKALFDKLMAIVQKNSKNKWEEFIQTVLKSTD